MAAVGPAAPLRPSAFTPADERHALNCYKRHLNNGTISEAPEAAGVPAEPGLLRNQPEGPD
jgi:hypothetical protein